MQAPLVVRDVALKEMLVREPGVAQVLADAASVHPALFGIDRATLGRIPVRIGAAAGGEKTAVVLAALRGGFLTMLVVDEPIAVSLVGA